MKSFDLFDTLVAGRDPSIPAGNQNEYFAIAENVAKVQSDSIVVSDYYDPSKAQLLLRKICGLENSLTVTEDGKCKGTIWATLPSIEEHLGDNPSIDIESARRAGIKGTLTTLAAMTETEKLLNDTGLVALSRLCRETRLSTFDASLRHCEIIQSQINFPMLFVASILLHRMTAGRSDMLMSSRDCYLWSKLQPKVRDLIGDSNYAIHYFYTSRIARLAATPSYVQYTNDCMGGAPVVVDLCGFGRSLPKLIAKTNHPNAPIWLMSKYPDPGNTTSVQALHHAGDSYIERANFAEHAMVVDVVDGKPVFSNPTSVQWEDIPEVKAQHRTFMHALSLISNYDSLLRQDVQVPSDALYKVLAVLIDGLRTCPQMAHVNRILNNEEQPILKEMDRILNSPPKIRTVVRLHCELPSMAVWGSADGMTANLLEKIKNTPELGVASNSATTAKDVQILIEKSAYYLPSSYQLEEARTGWAPNPEYDDVACLGSLRQLKNQAIQAVASMLFAKERGKKLRLHLNDYITDSSQDGGPVRATLAAMFARRLGAEIVWHQWMTRRDLMALLRTMTIGLQVSLTEASNVISLDMASAGIPLVVSPEVKWAAEESVAYPTRVDDVVAKMLYAVEHPELIGKNRANIEAHNASCFSHWKKFLGGGDNRVLFLVHDPTIDTGIITSTTMDVEMLKANGVFGVMARTNFTREGVARLIQEHLPTHVVSEASWSPLDYVGAQEPPSMQPPPARPPIQPVRGRWLGNTRLGARRGF